MERLTTAWDTRKKEHAGHMVLPIILLAAFVLLAILLILFAAKAYQGTQQTASEDTSKRTAAAYLREKVRQADDASSEAVRKAGGAVSVTSFGEGEALALREEENGKVYVTLLYVQDGYLMELFAEDGTEVSPEVGTKVVELEAMEASLDNSLLHIVLTLPQMGAGTEAEKPTHIYLNLSSILKEEEPVTNESE